MSLQIIYERQHIILETLLSNYCIKWMITLDQIKVFSEKKKLNLIFLNMSEIYLSLNKLKFWSF